MKPNYLRELRGPLMVICGFIAFAIFISLGGFKIAFGQGAYPAPAEDPQVKFSKDVYESPAGATLKTIQVNVEPTLKSHHQVSIFGATSPEIIADLLPNTAVSNFDVPVPAAGQQPIVIDMRSLHPLTGPWENATLVGPFVAVILPAGETTGSIDPMVKFISPPDTMAWAGTVVPQGGNPHIVQRGDATDFAFYAIGSQVTTTVTRGGVKVYEKTQTPTSPLNLSTPLCAFERTGSGTCAPWPATLGIEEGVATLTITASQPDGGTISRSVDVYFGYKSIPGAFLPVVQAP